MQISSSICASDCQVCSKHFCVRPCKPLWWFLGVRELHPVLVFLSIQICPIKLLWKLGGFPNTDRGCKILPQRLGPIDHDQIFNGYKLIRLVHRSSLLVDSKFVARQTQILFIDLLIGGTNRRRLLPHCIGREV